MLVSASPGGAGRSAEAGRDPRRRSDARRLRRPVPGGVDRRAEADGQPRARGSREAAYPYLTTVTCAGHATISTGSFPHTHGIFQNTWWDRELKKQVICNEDPRVKDVAYGAAARSGDSAYRLQVPTFADVMRSQRKAHVVSLALKDRSAIMLAGHGGDAVTWLSNNDRRLDHVAGLHAKRRCRRSRRSSTRTRSRPTSARSGRRCCRRRRTRAATTRPAKRRRRAGRARSRTS